MHILWWILTGIVVGWATGRIMKRSGHGSSLDAVLGIFGAIFFGYVVGSLGFLCPGGVPEAILVAAVGAALLTFAVRRLKPHMPATRR
jgi:uncharacterized membrane protein YeaQ/YmgE (transglycosylase-associated protein family)